MTHVLLVYQKLIPSAVLCGHVQLEYLASEKVIEYRHSEAFWVNAEMIAWADTVIIVRGALEFDLLIARTARRAGKRLIYVLDDDLFNVPRNIESSTFYNSRITQWIMKHTMSCCKTFVSPSPALIAKYGSRFQKTVQIEEPALQHELPHRKGDTVNIIYAGSLDRTSDIQTLLDSVLKKLIAEYGDGICITFFGAKPDIVEECGLRHVDYCMEYTDYVNEMGKESYDIGLAPMIATEFSAFKHYNKYVEYSSFGIVGVYSNVAPYDRAVRSMENGVLCDNTEEAWYTALKTLIDDSNLRNRMQQQCLREAESIYSLKTAAEEYCSGLELQTSAESREVNVLWFRIRRRLYRYAYFFARCIFATNRKIRKLFG